MSTTYYADFGTIDDAVFTFTYDSPAEGEAAARSSYLNEEEYMEVPSAVNYNGTTYVVTQLQGFDSYRSVVKELIIPSTIINWKSSFGYVSDFYGMAGLTTVHLRSGFDGTLMLDDQNHTIFNIFTENDASRATTFIIDSKEVYDAFANLAYGMPQTVKFPQSIDDGSNAYLASSYTLSTTEVKNGRTYNVYTQN